MVALCLAVFVPGLWSIPPVDRDESRFAQASRQMYESGDYVVPRVQDKPRLNKPPLIYWLQCASIAVFGDRPGQYVNANIWVFRVPSVLCAMLSVLLTWRLGLKLFDPRAALLGAALLAVCPLVVWDAHQARADQLLLATVVVTQLALWSVWKRTQTVGEGSSSMRRGARATTPTLSIIALWIALGVGVLAKGPISPMIAGLTAFGLAAASRDWRWLLRLKPQWGVPIVLAIVGPWVVLVGERVGWRVYLDTIWRETIGRSGEAAEGHWGPPGYHLVVLCALFWPGVLLTAAGVQRAFAKGFGATGFHPRSAGMSAANEEQGGWRGVMRRTFARLLLARSGRAGELFLLAWLVPSWVVFELVATKLPHYTMPLYPAIALLSARMTLSVGSGVRALPTSLRTLGARLGFGVWWIVGLVLCLAPVLILIRFGTSVDHEAVWWLSRLMFAGVFLSFVAIALAYARLRSERLLHALVLGMTGAVVIVWTMFAGVLPIAGTLFVSARVAGCVPAHAERVALLGFTEDSLVFWLRGRGDRINAGQLDGWINQHPHGVIVVDRLTMNPETRDRLRLTSPSPGTLDGFNYSTGKPVAIEIVSVDALGPSSSHTGALRP